MSLRISLLGSAKIYKDDKPITLRGKLLALLAYLLLTGKSHSRDHLIDLLFEEAANPRSSLRWHLSQLRKAVGANTIQSNRQSIGFNFACDYWLDVADFEAGDYSQYQGDFLEGWQVRDSRRIVEWVFFERERLNNVYQTALMEQLAAFEQSEDHETVIKISQQLIHLDNLREEWHRALMRAYALRGNRRAALAQFEVCRQTIQAELGTAPEPETQALYEQILANTVAPVMQLSEVSAQLPPFLQQSEDAFGSVPPFVGQKQALTQLNRHLSQVMAAQGQMIFISGGAGEGKTTLASAFSRRAQADYPDMLIAWGTCHALAGIGDPYFPFRDIMRMLTGDVESRLMAGTISLHQARCLWQNMLPMIQTLLDHGPHLINVFVSQQHLWKQLQTAVPDHLLHLPQAQRLAAWQSTAQSNLEQTFLFQQLTNVLQIIAEQRPLLLIFDDLQWADNSSISLLFHLSRRLSKSRILIVGIYRPEDVALPRAGQRHPLEPLLIESKRTYGDIIVDLSQTEGSQRKDFVNAYLDIEPNQLTSTFRQTLYQHSQGYPLFTVELLRAMRERGNLIQNEAGEWIESQSLDWSLLPTRVEAVIEERISRLEPDLRQLLAVASVEGEEFIGQVVAQVQGIEEQQILSQLSQILIRRHHLVQEVGEIQVGKHLLTTYQFTHILFQRYLYDQLSIGERRLLHAQVGQVREMLFAGQSDAIAVQLAHHFGEAHQQDKTRHYLRLAGERAARLYANDEAVTHFSQALSLAPAPAERITLLLAQEAIYHLQGNREAQTKNLDKLSELVQDKPEKEVVLALRRGRYANAVGNYDLAQTCYTAALAHQSMAASSQRAQAVAGLGHVYKNRSQYLAAIAQYAQALTLYRQCQDQHGEANLLYHLGDIARIQADYPTAKTYHEQALYLRRETGDRLGEAATLGNLGIIVAYQGDYDKAHYYYQQSLAIRQENGDRLGEAATLNNLGILAANQGRLRAASDYYQRSLVIKQEIRDWRGQARTFNNLGLLATYRGDYKQAQEYFQKGLTIKRELGDSQGEGTTLHGLGELAANQGDYKAARDYFQNSLTIHQAVGDRVNEGKALYSIGILFLFQGRYRMAGDYYQQSLTIQKEIGDLPGEAFTLASITLLAHLENRPEKACKWGQQAVALARKIGEHHALTYALTSLGDGLAALGKVAEAKDAYQEAYDLYQTAEQFALAREPLAGLTRLALVQNNLTQALNDTERLLTSLADPTSQGPIFPTFRVYLTCIKVLQLVDDKRAMTVLADAYEQLQTQATKVDEVNRHTFLENVPWHRELVNLWAIAA